MGLALKLFTCLVLTVCIVASVDADVSCIGVALKMFPCVEYLKFGGEVPALCCIGVKTLNALAQTTPDRQKACECLQSNSRLIFGLNETIASGLPAKCGVSIPYPISLSTNCTNVK